MPEPARDETGRVRWPALSLAVTSVAALVTHVGVARLSGPAGYASFAVLWACFFGLGGALSGQQQEVMRQLADGRETRHGPRLLGLAVVCALPLALLGWCALEAAGLPGHHVGLVAGLVGLSALTCVTGVLSVRARWAASASVLVVDGLVRSVLVLVAVGAGGAAGVVGAAIGLSAFSWVLLAPTSPVRAALTARATSTARGFFGRAAAAMAASGCSALMIAGFPLLVALAARGSDDAAVGSALAALVLVRSPLLMIVYAYRPVVLRSLLGRDDPGRTVRAWWRRSVLPGGVVVLGAALLGPVVVPLVAGAEFGVGAGALALMTAGAVMLGMVTVSTLALVAQDRHVVSLAGWLASLVVSIALLALVEDPASGVVWSAGAGPLAGLLVHAVALTRTGRPVRRRSVQAE